MVGDGKSYHDPVGTLFSGQADLAVNFVEQFHDVRVGWATGRILTENAANQL
jgi:hypothetical protein